MSVRRTSRDWKHVICSLLVMSFALVPSTFAGGATAQATTRRSAATAKSMFAATGYFNVAKKKGRWYLVSPQGDPFYAAAADTVSPVGDIDQTTGLCPYCQAVASNYPNVAAWGTTAIARLRSWGFNTLGSFSDVSLLGSQMPYTMQLNMGAAAPDVFATSFVTNAYGVAAAQVAPLANDPNLIGYFTDTEPSWEPPNAGSSFNSTLLDHYLALPAGSPGLAVAQQYIGDPNGFLFAVATHYFQVTSAALKKYDPHHLNLGVKMEGSEIQPQVFEAAQPYVDVFSVEDYALWPGLAQIVAKLWPDFIPIVPNLADFAKYIDKPFMIGEYTSLAAGPATPNTHPGVYLVTPNQQARAAAYAGFIAPLYENAPWMVGDGWFEYFDEPQGGRPGDNENDNFGLVNVNDQPYTNLTNEMALMHSIAPDRVLQTGPVCDSWARGPSGVTCTAYMPKVSFPLSIVDVSLPAATDGSGYFNGGVFAGGGKPAYTFTISQGSLPKGLKLDRKSGVIAGTPKATGTFAFTVKVSDSEGSPAVTQAGSIAVSYGTPVSVSTTKLKSAAVGAAYASSLAATGGLPPYTWSLTAGGLPTGLSLGTNGTLTGVPTVTGTYSFTATVTDSSVPAHTASRTFSLVVKAPR